MNQLEGMTILVDAARQLPETKHLQRALKWADNRLEVLSQRKRKRDASRNELDLFFKAYEVDLQNRFGAESVKRHSRKLRRALNARIRRPG
jgi:hypothetical protein